MVGRRSHAWQASILATLLAISPGAIAGDSDRDRDRDRDFDNLKWRELSAEWWQWALSIPASVNPLNELTDAGGSLCMVGQRGDVWFLGGTLFTGGVVTRKCSVTEGVTLFFPVANSVQVNTPDICGQIGSLSVEQMRANVAVFIDGVTRKKVTINGEEIRAIRRVRSVPFAATLPLDNVFVPFCETSPPGVFSASVDDGYYVKLKNLPAGTHTLQITALNPTSKPVYDLNMTYVLTVVPVSK